MNGFTQTQMKRENLDFCFEQPEHDELLIKLNTLRPPKKDNRGTPMSAAEFLRYFCSKIQVIDGCWDWTGSINTKKAQGGFLGDYGVIWWRGRKFKCHKLSNHLFNNVPYASKSITCHTCDRPRCCNPNHLYDGTHRTNSKDCKDRGRLHREMGSQRYNAILTEDRVREILAEAPFRKYGWGKAKAEKFGVGRTAISNVVCGFRWKQISGGAKL
jgi:hypothetical protein